MQKEIIERTTYSQNPNTVQRINRDVETEKSVYRSYNVVWLIIGVIEALLAFRFLFELLAANQYSSFVQLIYTFSYPFAAPFQDIFHITAVSYSIMDWSLIVAMAVYLIIGYGINQLLRIITPASPRVQQKLHPQ